MPVFSLRSLLIADAVICGTAGLMFLLLTGLLAGWFALPVAGLMVAGVALLPISGIMALAARMAPPPAWLVLVIIAGNLVWAAGSFVLPWLHILTPNPVGLAVVLGQGVAVAVLAGLEIRSFNQSRSSGVRPGNQ